MDPEIDEVAELARTRGINAAVFSWKFQAGRIPIKAQNPISAEFAPLWSWQCLQ